MQPAVAQKGGAVSQIRQDNGLFAVQCRLCGVTRRQLTRHLWVEHAMSPANYLARFPGAAIDMPASRKRSDECRAKQSKAATRRWASVEEREAQSERLKKAAPWKDKKLSSEHRRAISLGRLGQRIPKFSEALLPREGDGKRPHGGRRASGRRKGIPHPCRSIMEANFARVLLHEKVPYEYRPTIFGLQWVPSFRLLQSLYDLAPSGWVEVVGWQNRDGFLPPALTQKITAFKQATGEDVFIVSQSTVLWKGIESIYSSELADWEVPRRKLRMLDRN
jgi:hypothetical protein